MSEGVNRHNIKAALWVSGFAFLGYMLFVLYPGSWYQNGVNDINNCLYDEMHLGDGLRKETIRTREYLRCYYKVKKNVHPMW